jgi:hypothetical protein
VEGERPFNLFTTSELHTKETLGPSHVSNGRIRRRAFEYVTPNCQGQRKQILEASRANLNYRRAIAAGSLQPT